MREPHPFAARSCRTDQVLPLAPEAFRSYGLVR